MAVGKDHIALQYLRLRRHHDLARSRPDAVSLLDVTHCLRIWVDMKRDVDAVLAESASEVVFHHSRKTGPLKEILKGTPFTYLPLGSGWSSPGVRVQGFLKVNRVLTPAERSALYAMGPPRKESSEMTYSQWLGTEVYEVRTTSGERLGLSREVLIKRVANILGASHPMGSDEGSERENRFDPYVRDLHLLVVADMPATFYQVMEIAGDLTDALDPIFPASPDQPSGQGA